MICTPCAIAADTDDSTGHEKCLNGLSKDSKDTWCDCQHQPIKTLVVTEQSKDSHGPSTADQSGAAGSSTQESR